MQRITSYITSVGMLSLMLAATINNVHAAPILQENFNDSAYQGTLSVGPGPTAFSEAWVETLYYDINNANGWSFQSGAYYAANNSGDGAVLLNEGTSSGSSSTTEPLATKLITGLTVGKEYTVNFNYWGDNNLGLEYVLKEYLDGTLVGTLSKTEGTAGSKPGGFTTSFKFTATADSAVLGFGQASSTPASAIIDNVSIVQTSLTSVPEPATFSLIALGIFSLLMLRRKSS